MTPVELSRTVLRAVRCAVDDGELSVAVPEHAVVTVPGPGGRGDYATNIALQLARPAGCPPLQVAEILCPRLRDAAGVADVEITGPGFLNIHLEPATATAALVGEILDRARPNGGQCPSGPIRLTGTSRPDGPTATGDSHPAVGHRTPAAGPRQTATTGHIRPAVGPTTHTPTGPRYTPPTTDHTPYGHTPTLAQTVVPLRIPYEVRAEVVADTLVRVIATQGGRAEVDHVRPGETVDLRPVPAPEDPAPLGPDAARWALLYPAGHDRPRITADHLLQRESNPLFRVRYAHARARALGRNAVRLDFTPVPGDVTDVPSAAPLVRALAEYPNALTQAAAHRAPDRLARHLVAVADALLAFQHTVLPLGDEKPSAAHRARLALAEAAGTVLAGGLSLLGISAPDYL
ncbi:ArgS-related anticodon-binding protein NrtL [Streptomyces sp. NPDC046900]|uniref:ArgS-related anticodon-binding protein NrtL n=1 Tax=Streptomyces sp. NPDC046900 TaxID=3155473 RepID=UPI00340BC0F7